MQNSAVDEINHPRNILGTGLLIGILLLVMIPGLASAWTGSYDHRKEINITEYTHATVPHFEMNMTINTSELYDAGKLLANCSDLIFTDSSDNQLYFWNETPCYTNGSSTTYSVNVTLTAGSTLIYMYYDDPAATTGSSYRNSTLVYALWEDFENYADTTALETVWDEADSGDVTLETSTVYKGSQGLKVAGGEFGTGGRDLGANVLSYWSDGLIWQFAGRTTVVGDNFYVGTYNTPGGADFSANQWMYIGYPTSGKLNFGAELNHIISTNTWYVWRFTMNSSNSNYTTLSYSGTDSGNSHNIANVGKFVGIQSAIRDAGDINYIDEIVIRKLLVPWPEYIIGSEESSGPSITISTPTNTTYYVETFNLSWYNSSGDYDTVWYNLNNGTNTTITGNITLSAAVGSNNLYLYMNDTLGALYTDNVSFTFIPTVTVAITSPSNGSYVAPPYLYLNWSYVSARPCSQALYSIDGAANVSGGCINFTINISSLSDTIHNISVHVTNSESYTDDAMIWFTTDTAIVNCSAPGAVEALKFYFYTEDTLVSINGSAEYVIEDISSGYTYNLSVVNETNFSICIVDAPRTVDMMMLYRASGYEQRTYYFYHAELTSTLQSIDLFQISTSDGEKIEVNTRDNNDNDVEEVYVDIDRYYPETDSYRTVAIGRSDNSGIFITYLVLDTVFYRFTLSQEGTAVNTYGAMTITDTADDPEDMILYIGALETQFFEMIEDIGVSCDFNESSNNTVCSITDPSGLAVTATLVVQELGLASATTICTDTGSGASFTLTCNVPDPEGDYKYFVQIHPNPNPDYTIFTDAFYVSPGSNIYGIAGLFIGMLLIIAMAGVGIYVHEILGVILGVTMSVIVVSGLISLPAVAVTSMIVMGILILIGSRRR